MKKVLSKEKATRSATD
jgi:chromosome segregation ATPase